MTFAAGNLRGTPVYAELQEICRSHSVIISVTSDLRFGGSGTLIRYKGFYGILTATHVIAKHPNATVIYSPTLATDDPTIFLNEEIQIQELIYLETKEGIDALQNANELWPSGALDICLIRLDKTVFDRIIKTSTKKAVDLSHYKEKYLSNFEKYSGFESNHDWLWAVDGAPREAASLTCANFVESKHDGLFVCGGDTEGSTYKSQNLTLVHPPFDRTADIGCHNLGPTEDKLPSSFGGLSGGGMWQVSFSGNDGSPEKIHEMFFSGIIVSETPKVLYSRGPTSLYEIFIEYLDTLNKSEMTQN